MRLMRYRAVCAVSKKDVRNAHTGTDLKQQKRKPPHVPVRARAHPIGEGVPGHPGLPLHARAPSKVHQNGEGEPVQSGLPLHARAPSKAHQNGEGDSGQSGLPLRARAPSKVHQSGDGDSGQSGLLLRARAPSRVHQIGALMCVNNSLRIDVFERLPSVVGDPAGASER